MTSYASIDRIEGEIAVCEVELLPYDKSRPEDFATKETIMVDIPLKTIPWDIGEVKEGDILIVEHDGKNVTFLYYKDNREKARRLEALKNIMG